MKRLITVLIPLCILVLIFILLPKSENNRVTLSSIDDLNGLTVGMQNGLNYDLLLKDQCPDAEPILFSDFSAMNQSLLQGKISALLTESVSFPTDKIEHPSFTALDGSLDKVGNHLILKNDGKGRALAAELNEYIAAYTEDGTSDELFSYWITNYDRGNVTVDKSGITGENGVLTFVAEAGYEPACFAGNDGELIGFDVDFIYHFCRKYGYEPKIIPLDYDAMSAAVVSGRCDAAIGVVMDDEREEEVYFTDAYYYYDVIAVYNGDDVESGSFFENLKSGLYKTFIRENRWKMFLEGFETTLVIAILAVVFGSGLGLLLYLWCLHGKKAELKFTNGLCWLMSSTPTILLLMVLYYIVFSKYTLSNVCVAVIGFTLRFGCVFYERIVSGVKAVGIGQEEAAISQGFSRNQMFFRIQLPQAKRFFMSAYEGDVISLILETSVVGYITVMDLTKMSDLVRARTYEPFFPLIATALIYFLLIWLMTLLVRQLFALWDKAGRMSKASLEKLKDIYNA